MEEIKKRKPPISVSGARGEPRPRIANHGAGLTPSERACAAVLASERIIGSMVQSGQRGEVAAEAARRFRVNRAYWYDARRVYQRDRDLFERVRVGDLSLREALRVIDGRPEESCGRRQHDGGGRRCRRVAGPKDITPALASTNARIVRDGDGFRLVVSGDGWRNEVAAAMADERGFERALRAGLVITIIEEKNNA